MAMLQNLISIEKLTKKAGGKLLFSEITFGVSENEKIALIGKNGCGKSTFLQIIAGLQESDQGRISKKQKIELVYLEQSPVAKPNQSLIDFIMEGGSPLINLIREYEKTVAEIAKSHSEESLHRLSTLTEEMNQIDGWNLEQKISRILNQLSLTDLQRLTCEMSGGMLKKAALARVLVQEADVLLLDEPTNHLDIDTIRWLEEELKQTRQTLILVTHDRYFLNNICSKIIEMDENCLFQYEGNYAYYIEEKEARGLQQQKEQDRLKNILRTEVEWLKRGAKARTTKDSSRKNRIFQMLEHQSTQATQIAQSQATSDNFTVQTRRQGGKVLELQGISKSFGSALIVKPFSFEFSRGDRIGIVGPNGSGKSTFLNLISQKLSTDTGKIDKGINTQIAHFDQLSMDLPKETRVLELFEEIARELPTQDGVRVSPTIYLERFLFPKEQFNTPIGNLSGGEQRRIFLMSLLLTSPNFLILDEPTNDLDIQTLTLLEDFLLEFKGTLVIVSHDRYFLDRTVNTLFCLDGKGNIRGFAGDISQYYLFIQEEEREKELAKPKVKVALQDEIKSGDSRKQNRSKGLSFKEKQELEGIEPKLYALEEEKAVLEALFVSGESDGQRLDSARHRYDSIDQEIDGLMVRWEELESKQ